MKSSVVIKGCKSGMTVILNPDTPFEQLLEDVGKKFKESEKFWGSAQMTLTLEGREPVSYTHLDVYKRQSDGDDRRSGGGQWKRNPGSHQ